MKRHTPDLRGQIPMDPAEGIQAAFLAEWPNPQPQPDPTPIPPLPGQYPMMSTTVDTP